MITLDKINYCLIATLRKQHFRPTQCYTMLYAFYPQTVKSGERFYDNSLKIVHSWASWRI